MFAEKEGKRKSVSRGTQLVFKGRKERVCWAEISECSYLLSFIFEGKCFCVLYSVYSFLFFISRSVAELSFVCMLLVPLFSMDHRAAAENVLDFFSVLFCSVSLFIYIFLLCP